MKKDMAAGTDDSPQKTQPGILRGATLPLRSTSTDMFSLVQILQQAIRVGDEQQAKEIASQLAKRRAAVIMDVSIDSPLDTYLSNDIRVKVYVEDKDSSGVCVVLKLKPSMTIKQLKSKMLIEYSFPPEVQKWIIGKRIAEDNDTLFKCGIKSTGMSMFLYLISPKSIGLSKEKIMQKYRHILRNESPVSESPDVGQESIRSKTIKVKREIENPVQNTISVPAPELSQPTRSINASMENTHKSTAKTPSEEMKGRWECSACTFFNIPTRPGCEICGQPRPADFKVPEGYVIPQEELDRLAAEQEAERLAREQAGGPDRRDERLSVRIMDQSVPQQRIGDVNEHLQLTEQQLHRLLTLNDMYNAGLLENEEEIDPQILALLEESSGADENQSNSHLGIQYPDTLDTDFALPRSLGSQQEGVLDHSDFGRSATQDLSTEHADYALLRPIHSPDLEMYSSLLEESTTTENNDRNK